MRLIPLTTAFLGTALLAGSASAVDPGWKLVWSDEFDQPGAPDVTKWIYEEGFVRNHEAQYYTRDRRENARVEDGCLVIEGRQEHYQGKDGKTAEYTAASLNTHGLAAWTYGRVEVRAKLPQGKGVWPAIWMLGDNRGPVRWPACGEIDIMEFVGHTPNKVHGTMHWRQQGKHKSQGGKLTVEEPWNDFHLFAVEWSADRIDCFCDDRKYFSFDVNQVVDEGGNPFHRPFYLLLNLALGGSWGKEIDNSIFPQQFRIDYVRVYQREE